MLVAEVATFHRDNNMGLLLLFLFLSFVNNRSNTFHGTTSGTRYAKCTPSRFSLKQTLQVQSIIIARCPKSSFLVKSIQENVICDGHHLSHHH